MMPGMDSKGFQIMSLPGGSEVFPSSGFAVPEETCLTAGGDRNLPISEYMTSFSDSSAFTVGVRPTEGLVDLNFSANCKRKPHVCVCVCIHIHTYIYINVSQK